jgi:hypothetical protein
MIMGAVKRWWVWSIPKVTAGTSTEYSASCTEAFASFVCGHGYVGGAQIGWVSRGSCRAAINYRGRMTSLAHQNRCRRRGRAGQATAPATRAEVGPLSATNAIRFPVRA